MFTLVWSIAPNVLSEILQWAEHNAEGHAAALLTGAEEGLGHGLWAEGGVAARGPHMAVTHTAAGTGTMGTVGMTKNCLWMCLLLLQC